MNYEVETVLLNYVEIKRRKIRTSTLPLKCLGLDIFYFFKKLIFFFLKYTLNRSVKMYK